MVYRQQSSAHTILVASGYLVLILFALATALTVIDTAVWWLDGPRYTHAMWFSDRMDRINEDDKLRALIEQERTERERALQALREQPTGRMSDCALSQIDYLHHPH